MRRTDRLYELIRILRDGRLHRARDLADRLGVSLRTIYRDMETLAASGVPVEGERGVGYVVTAAITLPPLNLTLLELEALQLGMQVISEAGDEDLAAAAKDLSARIDAVLPEDSRATSAGWGFATYPFADAARGFRFMPMIRKAIRAHQKMRIATNDTAGEHPGGEAAGLRETAPRVIRPLRLDYWGRVWSLACWCETARTFREIRLDRISRADLLPELFVEEPGKSLADYLSR